MSRLPYQKTIIAVSFLLFLICMALILTGCASSRTGKFLNVAVVGAGVADVVTTQQAIQQGRGREANPFMQGSAWRQALVKSAGISAVIGVAALADLKGKPIVAHVVRGIAIGVWTSLAVHNARRH